MTPEPLTADERPRVSDERLALLLHAMPFVDPKSAQDEFVAVIADLRDARARIAEVEAQRDRILLEARCWAGEAKAQRHTVNEVGSALGGMADWQGIADAVRERIARAEAAETALAEARADAFEEAAKIAERTDIGCDNFGSRIQCHTTIAAAIRARGGPANG